MRESKPRLLRLRFYGYMDRREKWFGVCLDFNIAAEADSPEELKRKLGEMVESYIEVVKDTEDLASINYLLNRRAPLRDWACYYLICCAARVISFSRSMTFTEPLPLPAHGNC